MDWLPDYNYILASKSPRGHLLLKSLGIEFTVKLRETDESFPDGLDRVDIPVYLSKLKAKPFLNDLEKMIC
jgi:septum formation protein